MKETIRPSADLRNHYNEISKQCKESREVVIITVNGRVAPMQDSINDLRASLLERKDRSSKRIRSRWYCLPGR